MSRRKSDLPALTWETAPAVLRVEQVAALLGMGPTAVHEATRRGELPAVRVGRRLLYGRETLRALLEGRSETRREAA